jgi:hypothetical protein
LVVFSSVRVGWCSELSQILVFFSVEFLEWLGLLRLISWGVLKEGCCVWSRGDTRGMDFLILFSVEFLEWPGLLRLISWGVLAEWISGLLRLISRGIRTELIYSTCHAVRDSEIFLSCGTMECIDPYRYWNSEWIIWPIVVVSLWSHPTQEFGVDKFLKSLLLFLNVHANRVI